MTKKFIVVIDNSKKEQDDAFLEYIKKNNLNWWHWINNLWLLIDYSGNLSAVQLRDLLQTYYPEINCIVFEHNDEPWAGRGPGGQDRNMFTWLNGTWDKAQ